MKNSRFKAIILGLLALFAWILSACSNETGAHITNNTEDPITVVLYITGQGHQNTGKTAEPTETVVIPVPKNEDITISALYTSGYQATTLYTAEEINEGCRDTGTDMHCRFNYDGREFNMVAFSPAETFAANATVGIIAFSAVLLTITLILFFRNQKSKSQ